MDNTRSRSAAELGLKITLVAVRKRDSDLRTGGRSRNGNRSSAIRVITRFGIAILKGDRQGTGNGLLHREDSDRTIVVKAGGRSLLAKVDAVLGNSGRSERLTFGLRELEQIVNDHDLSPYLT